MPDFNEKYDLITYNDLSPDLRELINSSDKNLQKSLNRHMNDNEVHVTGIEKMFWNSKAPINDPAFTGRPTAPTPELNTRNDTIATTRFVHNALYGLTPERAKTADRLKGTVTFALTGGVTAPSVLFDGSNNVTLNVTSIDASAINGKFGPSNLSAGTYDINISGIAAKAKSAESIAGLNAGDIALKDSPNFIGTPTVPTAAAGDISSKIANTSFVNIEVERIKDWVKRNNNAVNSIKTVSASGKITAASTGPDANGNINLNVTNLQIDRSSLGNIDADTVRGFTVGSSVPANAKFTDTVYVHPKTSTDLTAGSFSQVLVDREGHVIAGANPSSMDINITGTAAKAAALATPYKMKFSGITASESIIDGKTETVVNVTAIPSAIVTEDTNRKFMTPDEKSKLSDLPSNAELTAKLDAVASSMDWKPGVANYSDIATTYTTPKKGMVVPVTSTGSIYRYNGTTWDTISSVNIPLATNTIDGKMSKEDKLKLDGIEEGATNYEHPATHPATMITEDATHKFVTTDEKTRWNDTYTKAEADLKFLAKLDAATNKATIGENWTIKPGTGGALDFVYNDTIKATLGTNGLFVANELSESGSAGASVTTVSTWKAPVANVSDLDATAPNGSVCLVTSTNTIYTKTSTGWTQVSGGSGTAAPSGDYITREELNASLSRLEKMVKDLRGGE